MDNNLTHLETGDPDPYKKRNINLPTIDALNKTVRQGDLVAPIPTLSEFLIEIMNENDWNEATLARRVKVSRATVNRWLHQGALPEFSTMRKIAEGLNVTLQEVIDAVEGRYKPLTEAERQALQIKKRYSPESIKIAALDKLTDEEFLQALRERYPDPDEFRRVLRKAQEQYLKNLESE